MSQSKQKPLPHEYQFWRKRVEGQLRHTINEHPEWFNLSDDDVRDRCIRSTAKRIIGEIVAGIASGSNPSGGATASAYTLDRMTVQLDSAASLGSGGISTAAPHLQSPSDRKPA